MTGSTAEKHDSFLTPTGDGQTIAEFSGKNLRPGRAGREFVPVGRHPRHVRGPRLHRLGRHQPDLPPGRAERRHADDPDGVRVVHGRGARLTRSRSCARRKRSASRRCGSCAGSATRRPAVSSPTSARSRSTSSSTGAWRSSAPTCVLTGRTLFGAASPKGQELEDQYFGPIRERILAFMMDLDRELWRLGIPAKTRHNEVAPGQFEMAPVFEADLGRLRPQHGRDEPDAAPRAAARPDVPDPREAVRRDQRLGQAQQLVDGHRRRGEPARPGQRPACQRPVPGVPGGRHPRASTSTPTSSGRASPTPAKDHRLGANEAPPAIMSIFLGSQLEDVVEQLGKGPASGSKKGGSVEARRHLAAGPAEGRHGPQPDVAVRLHRQQVRVPRGRLVGPDLLAADGPQHGRRRLAQAARRRAREARAAATSRA